MKARSAMKRSFLTVLMALLAVTNTGCTLKDFLSKLLPALGTAAEKKEDGEKKEEGEKKEDGEKKEEDEREEGGEDEDKEPIAKAGGKAGSEPPAEAKSKLTVQLSPAEIAREDAVNLARLSPEAREQVETARKDEKRLSNWESDTRWKNE